MGLVGMISEEVITQEFIRVVNRVYPKTGELLNLCYVKIKDFHDKKLDKRFYYLAIYCPDRVVATLQLREGQLKDIAENMGLIDVICVRATHLLNDPNSKIKEENPRLWLELNWIVSRD